MSSDVKVVLKVLGLMLVGVLLSIGLTWLFLYNAPSQQSSNPERAFVDTVTSQVVGADETDGRNLLELGMSICGAEGRGGSHAEIVAAFTKNGFTSREANVMIDAADRYLCDDND